MSNYDVVRLCTFEHLKYIMYVIKLFTFAHKQMLQSQHSFHTMTRDT